ncbi:hypothetical protein OUY22_34025 [Nonomuraea sp. MCN248]|uniref:DUF3168 domain-containing protein n=1 Tax=Nonomuraea corallina TaxID=2989783 RepID=A0ABT4SMN6_9ACTN|nr:hypothetical protein [Nonomuraea corallina]MDA0638452.1 hypothetical protein [Nonomuraea corallina]
MHRTDPFPFELSVTVSERTPAAIEAAAYPLAERFFGTGAEVHVISAKVQPDPEDDDRFTATVVFRRTIT